jgi:8-oxo-dGTP pyrophosphatase MutT (NUDIX family)
VRQPPSKSRDAAGVLIVARHTGLYPGRPVLLGQRSNNVRSPLTWALWGGQIEPGEDPATTALREFREECGHTGVVELLASSLWAHQVSTFHAFTFHNFIGVVEEQFDPPSVPNWEVAAARWMSLEEIDALAGPGQTLAGHPGGAHRGLRAYLDKADIRALLAELCREDQPRG